MEWFLLFSLFYPVNTAECSKAENRSDPFTPTVNSREAEFLQRARKTEDVEKALALFDEIDMEDASAAIDFAMGNLYFRSDKLDQAAQSYEKAIKKFPHFRSAKLNLGRVYLLQEKTSLAIRLYQDLVKNGQAGSDMLLLLGKALLIEDKPVSAENAFRQSLLLDPDSTDARAGLTKCLVLQERYSEGLSLAGEIIEKHPGRTEFWALLANALLATENTGRAIAVLESARRIESADNNMLALLADLYLNNGQAEEAVSRYEEAFKGDTAPSASRLLRAINGFLMINEPEHALSLINLAETMRRSSPEEFTSEHVLKLKRLRAELYRQKGNSEKAVEMYRQILREDPLNGETLMSLGDMHRDAGRLEDALIAYERLARVSGFEAPGLLRQAQVEVERERYSRAVDLLESAQAFRKQPHVTKYLEQVRRLAQYAD